MLARFHGNEAMWEAQNDCTCFETRRPLGVHMRQLHIYRRSDPGVGLAGTVEVTSFFRHNAYPYDAPAGRLPSRGSRPVRSHTKQMRQRIGRVSLVQRIDVKLPDALVSQLPHLIRGH